MSDSSTQDGRDFSTPHVEVCEVARFDNDGYPADAIALGKLAETAPDVKAIAIVTDITAHTDAE